MATTAKKMKAKTGDSVKLVGKSPADVGQVKRVMKASGIATVDWSDYPFDQILFRSKVPLGDLIVVDYCLDCRKQFEATPLSSQICPKCWAKVK